MENVKWWIFFCLFLCLFCFLFLLLLLLFCLRNVKLKCPPRQGFISYMFNLSRFKDVTLKQGVGNKLREQEMKNAKKPRTGNVVTDRS